MAYRKSARLESLHGFPKAWIKAVIAISLGGLSLGALATLSLLGEFTFLSITEAHAGNDASVRNRIKIRKKSHINYGAEANDSEEFNAERMEVLASKRRGLVEDIKRFIREASSEDQKAELNLRLGGLYMEDYYANLARAQSTFEAQMKGYDKKTKKKAPTLDNSEALASLDKARAVYRDLLKRYPTHRRRDEMLYFLALSSLDRGQTSEGMAFFKQLAEGSPNSRYANDALVQLGDHYFDANNFTVAESYYDKIVTKKHLPLLPYAIYKKAWCEYNTQRTQAALGHFKWVIENEDSSGRTGGNIRVRGEALKDITLPFVDLKLVNESIAFFQAQGDAHFRRGIETMASLYFEAGDHANAIVLNETLLKLDPNYAKNPAYEISIVESLKLKGKDAEAVARLFNRFPNYLEKSNWHEINAGKPETVKEAQNLFEETARKYAFQYHAEGQKTKNNQLYEVAKQLYAKYLEYFPRSPQAAQVRFYLAEILFKQEQYVAAADHYFKVYKEPTAGNLRVDAIRYSLSALDRQLNADRKKAGLAEISTKTTSKIKTSSESVLEQTPYSPVETSFIEISDIYLDAFPTAKDAADVQYEQAYLQYMHYDFGRAYKGFWSLVQKHPKHETAYASAYLILDVLNRRAEYAKLIAACKKFLDTPTFSKPQFKGEVASVLRSAELKRISLLEEKGEFKHAADEYVEYTKAYGTQDESLFEKALYNASVNYSKANLLMSAVETQEKFLRRFPKSALRENMLLQVAKTYETLAIFDKAALYFEQFATNYPRHEQSKSAWRLAGIYYWGSSSSAKAENTMLSYLRAYPSDSAQVERDLLDLYESQGASSKQIAFYLQKRAQRGIALSEYVSLSVKIAETSAAANGRAPTQVLEEALRVTQRHAKDILATPKGVAATAKLYFWLATQKENTFYRIKLTLPQRTLEANLARKLQLLKDLEKDYTHVVKLGDAEWGLASLYRAGAMYRHMAQDVAAAPVPAELSAEQLEMYRAELDKQMVKPFNEKAQGYSTSCLDKATEFNLLTGWTSRCYSLAGELQPERYPVVRTFYLPPLQLALLMPSRTDSKIQTGSVKRYAYPFYSAGLFQLPSDRNPASTEGTEISPLYESGASLGGAPGASPALISYRNLADERMNTLRSYAESERPSDLKKGMTFAYLNLLRLTNPQRAVPSILEAIQRDPQNTSLHNLLGLSYVELKNLPAAKVVWYSLIARGNKNASIWNNLGVVANLEGHEDAAIGYFNEASLMESPREALSNLGYIALKYRNGFEAKKHFEKAINLERDDATSQIGMAVAKLQNREMDSAKDSLIELSKKYINDPFARISLGYFLIDVEKESGLARQVLADFMNRQSLENDFQFRQAVQEARDVAGSADSSGSLPSIE